MKNTQIIAERIKIQSKIQGITVKKLLKNCELDVNTVTKMANGTDIFSQNLTKIADYLNVSVDYLLGRTDEPKSINQINTGNVGDNSNVNINNTEKGKTSSDSDDTIAELVAVFKTLDFCDKAKVMSLIAELSTK